MNVNSFLELRDGWDEPSVAQARDVAFGGIAHADRKWRSKREVSSPAILSLIDNHLLLHERTTVVIVFKTLTPQPRLTHH